MLMCNVFLILENANLHFNFSENDFKVWERGTYRKLHIKSTDTQSI